MEGGGSHGAARVCCLPEHHQKKQRGDVSRSKRSAVRVTVTAAITTGPGSLSKAKSAGTGTKKRCEKSQGQSSRRVAVVCDAPEAMGSEPGFGASEQSKVAR